MPHHLPEKMRRVAKEMSDCFDACRKAEEDGDLDFQIDPINQVALSNAVRKVNYWLHTLADHWEKHMPCPYCNGTGQETRDFALKGEPPVIGGYRIGPCRRGCQGA